MATRPGGVRAFGFSLVWYQYTETWWRQPLSLAVGNNILLCKPGAAIAWSRRSCLGKRRVCRARHQHASKHAGVRRARSIQLRTWLCWRWKSVRPMCTNAVCVYTRMPLSAKDKWRSRWPSASLARVPYDQTARKIFRQQRTGRRALGSTQSRRRRGTAGRKYNRVHATKTLCSKGYGLPCLASCSRRRGGDLDSARCTLPVTPQRSPKNATVYRTPGALRPSAESSTRDPAAYYRGPYRLANALRTPGLLPALPAARASAGRRDQGGPPGASPRDNAGKQPKRTASL